MLLLLGFFFLSKAKRLLFLHNLVASFQIDYGVYRGKKKSENYVNVLFYPVLIIFISIHSVLSKGQSKIQFFLILYNLFTKNVTLVLRIIGGLCQILSCSTHIMLEVFLPLVQRKALGHRHQATTVTRD